MSDRSTQGILWAMLLAVAMPGTARADAAGCAAAIQSVGATPVVQYDPFRSGTAMADLDVRLTVSGNPAECALALSAAGLAPGAGRTMTSGSDALTYRLFYRGIELGNDPEAYVAIDLSGDDRQSIVLRLEVPAGQIGPAGTYADPLILRLVDRQAGNARLGTETSALVTTAMESRAQVNVAGTSTVAGAGFGVARLDLGTLRMGSSRTAMIQVRSTAPVTLSVTSQNHGLLRRIGGADTIAYGLSLDSQDVALVAGTDVLARSAAPSRQGASYPLIVTVRGDPDHLPAGDYQDLVTIDVMPN
jgi:spore coat protein U-like protein